MQQLRMELGQNSYDIFLENGLLQRAGKLLQLNRRVLIVTDDGVPEAYARTFAAQCGSPVLVRIPQGEGSKSLEMFRQLSEKMLQEGFTRSDCVAAVGGGVVGDLSGFAAACYMRGIDFYNIPTTALSQIDSSIGGKVAVNLGGVKNIVGAFYQPRGVLIDPTLLSTLSDRQLSSGLAEAIKAGVVADEPLLELFERTDARGQMEEVLLHALRFKKRIVEQDERESGPRKLLNFGHTIGHGIESVCGLGGLLHGECVGLGMLPMCTTPQLRRRVAEVLEKYGLPTRVSFDPDAVFEALRHDKKAAGDTVTVVTAAAAGAAALSTMSLEELHRLLCFEAKEGIGR